MPPCSRPSGSSGEASIHKSRVNRTSVKSSSPKNSAGVLVATGQRWVYCCWLLGPTSSDLCRSASHLGGGHADQALSARSTSDGSRNRPDTPAAHDVGPRPARSPPSSLGQGAFPGHLQRRCPSRLRRGDEAAALVLASRRGRRIRGRPEARPRMRDGLLGTGVQPPRQPLQPAAPQESGSRPRRAGRGPEDRREKPTRGRLHRGSPDLLPRSRQEGPPHAGAGLRGGMRKLAEDIRTTPRPGSITRSPSTSPRPQPTRPTPSRSRPPRSWRRSGSASQTIPASPIT